MRLRTVINSAGRSAAGIVVPDDFVEALGGGRRPKVRVTARDYTFRTSIAPMGGVFMMPITNETRAASGLVPGEVADFEIRLDTEPREVAVPADLVQALARDDAARAAFERLSYSNKRRLTMPIEAIKGPEARARRVERTVAELRG